jgi:murein DD-endopeptidase MepM/ murein hydrolase activator NlpD
MTSFQLSYPQVDGYTYVLYRSDDGQFWKPLTVTTASSGSQAVQNFSTSQSQSGFFRIERFTSYYMPPFLNFPLQNGNSTSSRVSSILDHHGRFSYEKDGAILTCRGQLATVTKLAYGYRTVNSSTLEACNNDSNSSDYYQNFKLAAFGKDAGGSDFSLPFTYDDGVSFTPGAKGLLFFDGHTGYDYPAPLNTPILAAADGNLDPSLCGTATHQIVINHVNGYRTLYLHCDSWIGAISNAVDNNPPTAIPITAGQIIGYVGSRGASSGNHLHFEMRRYNSENGTYILVDPYGYYAEDGSTIDPPMWLSGQ